MGKKPDSDTKTISKKSKKQAFTIRLDKKTIENLNRLGQEKNLTPATLARFYIQFSDFFIADSNLSVKTYDETELIIVPKGILENMLKVASREAIIDIGDNLAQILNNNAQILGYHSLPEKITLLRGLGWLQIKIFEEKATDSEEITRYWGIRSRDWPLELVHALLYRLLHNRKYPPKAEWTMDFLEKYVAISKDERNKIAKEAKKNTLEKNMPYLIQKFEGELGGRIENFAKGVLFYKFESLKVPNNPE